MAGHEAQETLGRRYRRLGWWDAGHLSDGIEAAARETPNGLALADRRSELTWRQLAGRVAGAVDEVRRHQVPPGAAAVLVSGNTVDGVVAFHALLRAGVTAVVLDRRCGPADIGFAVEAVPAALVVLPREETARLAPAAGTVPCAVLEDLARPDRDGPVDASGLDRDQPAVVLFTSGTTSRPKGVVHSLNTLTAGARNMAQTTEAGPDSVIYLISPLTSITGVMQMMLAAETHARLVLDDEFQAEQALDRINRYGATLLGGAPVIVERLIEVADRRGVKGVSLRTLALGGTVLPRQFLERISMQYGIDVIRVYGSSESPNATGRIPGGGEEWRRLADDGALMPGTEVKVGSSGHPQEGLIRGPALMLGYLDQDDNRAAFEDGWYRTGDLLDVVDGRLTVIGRLKEVVSRNGIKISLGEIDAALADHPDLVEAAAFAVPDKETGERMGVAVVARPGSEVTLDGVLEHLTAAGVAIRKLPEQVTVWDEPLPRTASGKVVRATLTLDAPGKESMLAPRVRDGG